MHRGDRFSSSRRRCARQPGLQAVGRHLGLHRRHREQISNEQWQRSQPQPAPAPLIDRTATDDGLPLGLVLIGVTVPLGLLIVAIGKPALSYRRHRRHPTSVA